MATFRAMGKPMLKATSRNGRSGGLGPQQVIAADRDDSVDEVIRGDLAGSRAALALDVMPLARRPVVHNGLADGSVEDG